MEGQVDKEIETRRLDLRRRLMALPPVERKRVLRAVVSRLRLKQYKDYLRKEWDRMKS